MRRRTWRRCSPRFFEGAALALVAALLASGPRRTEACAGGDETAEDLTTFDPAVLGDAAEASLFWDPETRDIGKGPCETCAADEMRADWQGFWGSRVPWADWSKILLSAKLPEIDALIGALKAPGARAPQGFAKNAVLALRGTDRDDAIAALYFVGFARRVEPFSAPPPSPWDEPRRPPAPAGDAQALADGGQKALARAGLPFLRQRYAFQLVRLRFYAHDWPGVVAFCRENHAALEAPSADLKWRAQYYVAGALLKMNQRAEANLTLARVHVGWPPLASVTALDFQPMQQADWKQTLARAASVQEKIELWRLVGLKLDALAAMEQIVALDPRSPRLGVLAVREINRAEATSGDLAALQQLCAKLADSPTTDRRWLFDLVAGHAAALRGQVAEARRRLDRARAARPGDPAVATQAAASMALALARTCGRPEPRCEDELARNVGQVDTSFSRSYKVLASVRDLLSQGYRARGRCVEAELFAAGACADRWSDPAFLQAMIARVSARSSPFDRFMIDGAAYKRDDLRTELALLQLRRGDFESARQGFREKGVGTTSLGTDPFVVHVVDCHDCDHRTYAGAKWTRASFALRLIDLRERARRPGKEGAAAAFALGSGYYNMTWFGNARSFLEGTHVRADLDEAGRWYERAFDAFADREDKARAAFMAAKSELARQLWQASGEPYEMSERLPIPSTWFPIVHQFADTNYYREILRECGHYRRWAERRLEKAP